MFKLSMQRNPGRRINQVLFYRALTSCGLGTAVRFVDNCALDGTEFTVSAKCFLRLLASDRSLSGVYVTIIDMDVREY